ncbi:MAG: hypothetical protein K2G07_03920 [Muribaculaceae bacterium]|nr:hypothetical protein [Muribaculaceae bacterium]
MKNLIAIIVLLMCVTIGYILGHNSQGTQPGIMRDADTIKVVVYHDTIIDTMPAPTHIRRRTTRVARLPVVKLCDSTAHSISTTDSATVAVPVEQHVYTDSTNYRAVISGYGITLDTMQVFPRREVITVSPRRKRWSIGLQAGYGIGPKGPQPYIGVGVSYSIWQF